MELVDIKVRKNKKGDLIEGEFFVKELSFDECMTLHSSASDGDENSRMIQMCLVDSEGNHVFKPQQVKLIKDRLNGVDMTSVLIVANGLNDFTKIGELAEKYAKNSKSDQKQD